MKQELTQWQRAIIVGTVLGDSNIEYTKWGSSRLQVKQADRYRNYVFWLHRQLQNICRALPKQRPDTKQWYFGTRYIQELSEIRALFYRRRKIVPEAIGELLVKPISLAIWYMDDGRLDWRPKDHYAFNFSTDAFSLAEVRLLQYTLKRNFGIEATVQYPLCREKRYPKLYIGVAGRDRFISLVRPHILDCFSKKIPPK